MLWQSQEPCQVAQYLQSYWPKPSFHIIVSIQTISKNWSSRNDLKIELKQINLTQDDYINSYEIF